MSKKEQKMDQFFVVFSENLNFTEKKTYSNKGWNLLEPYHLTVLLSIPFDKLPWVDAWQILQKLDIQKWQFDPKTPEHHPMVPHQIGANLKEN